MSLNSLCLNCFQIKGNYEICPYCGFVEGTPPAQAFHLRPGETLGGRYIIGTVLGYGGFGVTYKAWDNTLSSVVAVKEFYPGGLVNRIPGEKSVVVFSGDKSESYKAQLTRFLEEARNMARFSGDPHIVGVYDFFQENNTAYIVMEYLDGMTLKEYMAQMGGSLPEEEALRFATPILEAIDSIHKKKIVHRDISPDNIFVLKDGRVKALDFGAARFSDNPEGLTSTVIIKPGYAPPEQYRSKMKQGPWTDLYAAGATLYKMLTGITPNESVDRIEKDMLKLPSELIRLSNPALDRIIMKAMALAPELRFQKPRDFIDALEGRREVELPEIEQKKRRTRRVLSGVLSVAAVIALLAVTALLASNPDNNPSANNPLANNPPANIIEAEPVTIEVLIRESEEPLFETLVDRYEQEFDGQTVHLIVAPDDDYNEILRELVLEKETPPTLFRSDTSLPAVHMAPLNTLASALRARDYLFLSNYRDLFPERNQMPLTFFVPVLYANITLASSSDVIPSSAESLDGMLDPDAAELYGAGAGVGVGVAQGEDPAELFLSDRLPYLLSTTKRLREVQESLPGYYAVLSPHWIHELDVSCLDNLWSVSANVDENQQLAAQLFLGFLLSDYAQNLISLQYSLGIPINRTVFKQYIEINPDLRYISELVSNSELE